MGRIPRNLKGKTKTFSVRLVRAMQKAIKAHCYECMGVPPTSKRLDCGMEDCPLFPYRPWDNKLYQKRR